MWSNIWLATDFFWQRNKNKVSNLLWWPVKKVTQKSRPSKHCSLQPPAYTHSIHYGVEKVSTSSWSCSRVCSTARKQKSQLKTSWHNFMKWWSQSPAWVHVFMPACTYMYMHTCIIHKHLHTPTCWHTHANTKSHTQYLPNTPIHSRTCTHTHRLACKHSHKHPQNLTPSISVDAQLAHVRANQWITPHPTLPRPQPCPQAHLLDCPGKVAGLWDYLPKRQFLSSCPLSTRLGITLPPNHKTACSKSQTKQNKNENAREELMWKKRWLWTLPDVKSCPTRRGMENWRVLSSITFPCPVWK